MEFDGNLSKIQGALLSLKKRNLLNSNVSDEEVVTTLKDVIINMTDDEKRKVTFYMVLNTRLSVTEKLKEDENIYLLINDPVLLEINYLIKYTYDLGLENYLMDVIKNCSSLITVEIIKGLLREFQKNGIDHIFKLWKAVYVKIYLIEKNCDDEGGEKMFELFNEIYSGISLNLFFCGGKTTKLTVEDRGEIFYSSFEFVLYCANVEKYVSEEEMYKIGVLEGRDCRGVNLTEKCKELLVVDLRDKLECITIDLWMSWLESYRGNQTYQEAIGNVVYDLCKLEDFFPPDILSGLCAFQIKPKGPDVNEIINKINNGEEKWYKVLIENFNTSDSDSLKCILENSHLADDEDVENVLEKLKSDCDTEVVKKVILRFVKLSKDSKWLEFFLKQKITCDSFSEDLIETFNKITIDKIEVWDVLCLFIQNSHETINKICECGVYNPNKIEFFIEILKQVENFHYEGKNCLGNIFLNILNEINNKYKKNLILFVNCLKKENLLDSEFFDLLVVKIEKSINECRDVIEELEVLKCVIDSFITECNVLALLCEMSDFLESFSWDLYNFDKSKLIKREIVEDIVEILLKEFKKGDTTPDGIGFLRRFIYSKSETSQGVFCDLWFEFGENWFGSGKYSCLLLALAYTNHSLEFLYAHLREPEEIVFRRSSVIISLYVILPLLPYRRWEILQNRLLPIIPEGKNHLLEILDIFLSVLCILSEKLNKDQNILPCYEQCVRNFGRLLKTHTKKSTPEVAAAIIEKVMFLLTAVEDKEVRKNCCLILSSVVLDFVEIFKQGEDGNLLEKVELELELLEIEEVTDAIKKKITE